VGFYSYSVFYFQAHPLRWMGLAFNKT
jgi:hypothetical protein